MESQIFSTLSVQSGITFFIGRLQTFKKLLWCVFDMKVAALKRSANSSPIFWLNADRFNVIYSLIDPNQIQSHISNWKTKYHFSISTLLSYYFYFIKLP